MKVVLVLAIATMIISSALSIVGIICKIVNERKTYQDSMPKDNYVEASFDNWLDWFTIAPDKWIFRKRDYDNSWAWDEEYQVEIPARKVVRMNRIHCEPFIKFSYPDFKKFRKWHKRYEADKAYKAKLEQKERLRQEVNRSTIELLKVVQGDIDAYKAKIDGEMDKAVDTCREVTSRIKYGGNN